MKLHEVHATKIIDAIDNGGIERGLILGDANRLVPVAELRQYLWPLKKETFIVGFPEGCGRSIVFKGVK